MTIQTTNIDATTADAVDLTAGNEVFYTVATNVVLESQFANGVVAESNQNFFIYNNGGIVANGDGVILEDANDHFYNEPTGTVFGFRAVELTTTGATFVNYGAASGDVYGAEDTAGNNIISNFGMIEGPTAGLNIAAGGDTITNSTTGTIGGGIDIASGGQTINNAGAIDGSVTFTGTANSNSNGLTNSGEITGSIKLAAGTTTIVNDGTINGAGGTAITLGSGLDTVVLGETSVLDGAITNFATGDIIDLQGLQFNGTKYSGGVLTLLENGSQVGQLGVLTPYSSPVFLVSADGSGGTEIVAGNPGPPAATTAVMILTQASSGNYEIYDIGNNAVLATYPLMQVGSPWQAVDVGGFDGSDTSDVLLRNSSTGAFELYDAVSGNNANGPLQLGTVSTDWSVLGFGDFSGSPGETDMLMRQSGTAKLEVYDISNNQITNSASMGAVGPEWNFLGVGDFTSKPNETDMLMRDANNGALEVFQISNNAIVTATSMGAVGSEWQFLGVGDFSGNPGETDMLMRDVNNGAMDVFNLQNAQIASARQIAAIGTEWSVVGIGDFDGNAADTDVVTRDSQNGAFEFYVFRNETMVSASQIASVGTDWQAVGIASYQSAAAAIASSASSGDNTDALAPLGSDLLATGLPAPFIAGQFGGVETQAAPAAEVPSLSIGGSGTAQMLSASLFHPA